MSLPPRYRQIQCRKCGRPVFVDTAYHDLPKHPKLCSVCYCNQPRHNCPQRKAIYVPDREGAQENGVRAMEDA